MDAKPRICAAVTGDDAAAVKQIEPQVDLFEVRIDLIGRGWRGLVKELEKPWIACNRIAGEGGEWQGSEADRLDELVAAAALGASIIDIELATAGLADIINNIKGKASCLISFHDLQTTPPPERLREIVLRQIDAGADICKLATTARRFEDNLAMLRLLADFPATRLVAFAMGEKGHLSRVLCPLAGGDFTYASMAAGRESAPGQLTVGELTEIYKMVK